MIVNHITYGYNDKYKGFENGGYNYEHPVELSERLTPDWTPGTEEYFCRTCVLPVKIGNGCWLGGGVIVLPGVPVGNKCDGSW